MNEPNIQNTEQGHVCPETNDILRLSSNDRWGLTNDEPDIRGWRVVDSDNNQIGHVDDMLVNAETLEADFIVVRHGGFLGIGSDSTPIPTYMVSLDVDEERVDLHGAVDDIRNAPLYTDYSFDYRPYFEYWCGKAAGQTFSPPRIRVVERDIY